jgi:hypothetical protein
MLVHSLSLTIELDFLGINKINRNDLYVVNQILRFNSLIYL